MPVCGFDPVLLLPIIFGSLAARSRDIFSYVFVCFAIANLIDRLEEVYRGCCNDTGQFYYIGVNLSSELAHIYGVTAVQLSRGA